MSSGSFQSGTAIVLGGTEDHRHLMRLLRQRRYRVVLVDYLHKPVARADSDEHVQADAFDPQVVSAIARKQNAKLVISACIDQAVRVACKVSEQLSLPTPFSADVATRCTNKLFMKKAMVSAGIPTARFVEVGANCLHEIRSLHLPVVVKPADSHGSWGVRKAHSYEEAMEYITAAVSISRSGQAIVEEFLAGHELSVDAVIAGHDCHVLACSQLWKWEVDHSTRVICQAEMSVELRDVHRDALRTAIQQVAKEFGLRNTPLLMQGIYGPEGFKVIEFAPRVGGGSKYCDVIHQTGVDLVDAVVDSYLQKPLEVSPLQSTSVLARTFVYGRQGEVARLRGFQECIREGLASDVRIYKSPGDRIDEVLASKDRLASFRVSGESRQECAGKVARIAELIDAEDPHGRSLVKHLWMRGPWV